MFCGQGAARMGSARRRRRAEGPFAHAASGTGVTGIVRCQSRVTVRCTVGVLFIAAVLLGVWLAVAVGYGLGSAPGQHPGP